MKFIWPGLVGMGLGWGCSAAQAAPVATNEALTPTNELVAPALGVESNAPAGGPDVTEPATNEVPPVVEEPATNEIPPVVIAPSKPQKTAPVFLGSDMRGAFEGAGSSRFGINGRVHKVAQRPGPQKPEDSWQRRIELGINTSKGNSDTLRYDGSISGAKETGKNSFFLKAGGRYGESEQIKDAESAYGEAKAQHSLSERMYAGLDANIYHDQIAALTYRARGSLSLGRHFIWTERTVLNMEAGPGYVAEKKGGETEGFMAGRAAEYLEYLITPSLQIWQSVEYVPNLGDSSVFFVNSEIGLETVLMSNLSLRFVVQDRYDSAPAENKKSNDLLTTTSLNWSF